MATRRQAGVVGDAHRRHVARSWRSGAHEARIEPEGGGRPLGELAPPDRLAAAAVVGAVPVALDDPPHHLGRLAGQRGGGDHVDVGVLPHGEGPAGGERVDQRRHEVPEPGVLGARTLGAGPVHAVDRADAGHRAVAGALADHQLARQLEDAVDVDRIGRRRLVGAALRAVEDPVGGDEHDLGAHRVRRVDDVAGGPDVARPAGVAVGEQAAEIVEDGAVDDGVGACVVDGGAHGRGVRRSTSAWVGATTSAP